VLRDKKRRESKTEIAYALAVQQQKYMEFTRRSRGAKDDHFFLRRVRSEVETGGGRSGRSLGKDLKQGREGNCTVEGRKKGRSGQRARGGKKGWPWRLIHKRDRGRWVHATIHEPVRVFGQSFTYEGAWDRMRTLTKG